MRSLILSLVLVVTVLAGGSALGGSGVPWVGWIDADFGEEVSLFVMPDGSGPSLTAAMGYGGHTVDATIVMGLVDINYDPIPHFPWEDIWLDPETSTASRCLGYANGGFSPDSNTDFNGETVFASSLAGGGWTEGPVWVYLNGDRAMDPNLIMHPPVQLRINSADINGDHQVNLTDVAFFAQDLYGGYQYRSDFYWDGVLNIVDLSRLAAALGSSCE